MERDVPGCDAPVECVEGDRQMVMAIGETGMVELLDSAADDGGGDAAVAADPRSMLPLLLRDGRDDGRGVKGACGFCGVMRVSGKLLGAETEGNGHPRVCVGATVSTTEMVEDESAAVPLVVVGEVAVIVLVEDCWAAARSAAAASSAVAARSTGSSSRKKVAMPARDLADELLLQLFVVLRLRAVGGEAEFEAAEEVKREAGNIEPDVVPVVGLR